MTGRVQTAITRTATILVAFAFCLPLMAKHQERRVAPTHAPVPVPQPSPPPAPQPPPPTRRGGDAERLRDDAPPVRQGSRGEAGRPRDEASSARPERNLEGKRGHRSTDVNSDRVAERAARADHLRKDPDWRQNWNQKTRPATPRSLRRAENFPSNRYWGIRYHYIFDDLVRISNKGFIPVTAVPSDVFEVTDFAVKKGAGRYAGWKGYGFIVPPGETIAFNLYHSKRNWFRMIICDKWGDPVPGALGSLHPQPPLVRQTCKNNSNETRVIYVIVDDPGWWSREDSPYTMEIARSWNPDLFPEDLGRVVSGVWGMEQSINARFAGPRLVMPGFW